MAGRVMKILYDHQIFSSQKFGGISRYFYELMRHSEGLFDYEVSGVFSENEYVKPLRIYREFPMKCSFRGKQRIINRLNRMDSIRKIKWGNCDVLHPTYYDPYLLKGKKCKDMPLVIDVHDMIFEKFPQYFKKPESIKINKERYFRRADKIIATSRRTKEDLLSIYPYLGEDKIIVIYRGKVFPVQEYKQKKEDYVLYTGQRNGYKNFNVFITAVAPLLLQYNLRLICTGQVFTKFELVLLEKEKIFGRTICTFVRDDELPELYAKALVFVFPSLYEGFGLPILEAFAAGCPAILSNTSCFPEIAGNAALYFDPYSIEDMRSAIEKVIMSPALQDDLINRGKERIKKYSWEKCAEETKKVYSVLENKGI
jgi:glycosyltransferase involved in cell wall biosynthesis